MFQYSRKRVLNQNRMKKKQKKPVSVLFRYFWAQNLEFELSNDDARLSTTEVFVAYRFSFALSGHSIQTGGNERESKKINQVYH